MYYQVRNYCEDCVSFKYTAQSVLDSGWKASGCESHTVRDFTILAHIPCSCSVISRYDPTSGLPGSPNAGDSYISTATANGWTVDYIYYYDGTEWEGAIPCEGKECWVETEDHTYVFSGTSWYKTPDSINSESEKGGPVSGDIVLIEDSEDSYKKKKAQLSNLPCSGPTIKSGDVSGSSFSGDPKKYTLTFGTAFSDANYAFIVLGEDDKAWTYESKTASSVIVNSGANEAFAGLVSWIAIAHSDP